MKSHNQLGQAAVTRHSASQFTACGACPRRYVPKFAFTVFLILNWASAAAGALDEAHLGELFGYRLGGVYFENEKFDIGDVQPDGYVDYTVRNHRSPSEFYEVHLHLTPLTHKLVKIIGLSKQLGSEKTKDCAIKYVAELRKEYRDWDGGLRKPRGNETESYIVLESDSYWLNVVGHKKKCAVTLGFDFKAERPFKKMARSELDQLKLR